MLDLDKLRAFGADVDEGLARCMNAEDFYIGLVNSVLADDKLKELKAQIAAKDLDAAFETAHAMKGMYANLSLTPLVIPISEITELLRARTDTDYSPLLEQADEAWGRLLELSK